MDQNMMLNTVYHSFVLSGIAIGYNMVLNKMFRYNVGDLAEPSAMEIVKLTSVITASMLTKSYLEKMKIIPQNIKHI